ncbi:MAG: HAMP domain-containing histidine kinase [Saprospiraceae bacterium]|nr:HAMP domain-containing histidine kinase [Saprospiraceae bacterium]
MRRQSSVFALIFASMKRWWNDPIVWLMLVSLALLLYLGLVWLTNSYNREYFQVIRDGEYQFTNAIRAIEDSLLEANFDRRIVLSPDSIRRIHHQFIGRKDTSQAFIFRIGRDSTGETGGSRLRRGQRRIRDRSEEGFVGSLALQLAIERDSSFSFDFQSDELSQDVLSLIEQYIDRRFIKNNFEHSYHLVQSSEPGTGLNFTKPFTDMMTGVSYYLEIQPNSGIILKKITGQIAFVFFTFLITSAAFFFSYRTLQKQRHLTVLKNDLISNISHELRTPISTVKVALEALDRFSADEDHSRRKEYLEISKSELDRLDLLVDNVLRVSLDDREKAYKMERFSLKELIDEILHTMQLQFEKAGVKIDYQTRVDTAFILGDRMHITSVLYNLLDNAIKYSRGVPEIKMELKESTDKISLSVADQGLGIPKVYLSKIFERFFRVPTGDIHNTKGYGLGLSYVSDVIKKHGGSIKVKSVAGQGSEFTINFPVSHGKS